MAQKITGHQLWTHSHFYSLFLFNLQIQLHILPQKEGNVSPSPDELDLSLMYVAYDLLALLFLSVILVFSLHLGSFSLILPVSST